MKSRTLLGWWLLSCAIGLPLPLNSPTAVAQTPAAQQLDDLLGNWAFTLPDQNVAWLSLAQSGGQLQGIQGPGAIFGRLKPSKNAGRPGGQWNRYVLTLVDRHITVELNGETVIDNQLLEGCTGGGIQAHDEKPGPIFLQGDHTSVQYRNLVIRPVVSKPK